MKFNKLSVSAPAAPVETTGLYPIFFPRHAPITTGFAASWWWFDPILCADDIGPFQTRSEAVADWAMEHFKAGVEKQLADLDLAIGSPLLGIETETRKPELARLADLALAERLANDEVIRMADAGLELVGQLVSTRDGDGLSVALEAMTAR